MALKIERYFTALDIGTSKVCAMIAGQAEDGRLHVLGSGQRESQGVSKGYIADMAKTEHAISHAVEMAERMAGTRIEDVWVSFSGGNLSSDLAKVELDLGGQRIEQDDVDDLLSAGRNAIDPNGRVVLHAQPALYTIDGLAGVRHPLGLHADRLGVDIHVVLADGSPLRNLDTCVRQAHLEVHGIVAAPVATGMACLTDEERDLGVALVEIGAAVTNISLFAGGVLVGIASLPFGGADITDDIASAFGIRRSQAERLKCVYGSALTNPRDNQDMLDADPASTDPEELRVRVNRAQMVSVIRQRLDLVVTDIAKVLKTMGFSGPVGRQVVLTGGGAELKGIADHVQGVLGRAVRIGAPGGLVGTPEAHAGPSFATLCGLVLYAASDPVDLRQMHSEAQDVRHFGSGRIFARIAEAIRANF